MEMGAGNSPLQFFSFPQALAASGMSLDEGRELQRIGWISSVPNARNAVLSANSIAEFTSQAESRSGRRSRFW